MPKQLTHNTIEPSDKEKSFREEQFKDLSSVFKSRLFCTCCLKDVKNEVLRKDKVYIHPFFQVIICKSCLKFYGDGYISADEDGSDKYCRWCGQGGCLYVCSDCPVAICKSCIKRNMARSVWREVEKDDWKCFSCDPKPLYELRALAWALKQLLRSRKQSKTKTKAVVEVVRENTLEGHLLNGLDYEISAIKQVQKVLRSSDCKLGGIPRRKEVTNRQAISWEIVNKISQEISNHISNCIDELKNFKENFDSYINGLTPVIDNMLKNESEHSNLKTDTEIPLDPKNKRNHSSDEEIEKSNKKKNKTNDNSQKNAIINGRKPDSNSAGDTETDTQSNEVVNEDWAIIDSNKEIEEKSEVDCTENKSDKTPANSEENKVPKITLRIRKIEEVNKALMEEGTKAPTSTTGETSVDCEVIELDDDEMSQHTDNAQKSPENDDKSQSQCGETKDSGENVIKREINTRLNEDTNNANETSNLNPLNDDNVVNVSGCDGSIEEISSDSGSNERKKKSKKNVEKRKKGTSTVEKAKLEKEKSKSKSVLDASNVDIFSENDDGNMGQVISSTSSNSSQDSSSEENKKKKVVKKSKGARQSNANKRPKQKDDLSDDDDSDIEKLVNFKGLEKKIKSEKDKTEKIKSNKGKKKTNLELAKREKEKTILDYCGEADSDNSVDLEGEVNMIISMRKHMDKNAMLAKLRAPDFKKEEDDAAPSSIEISDTDNNYSDCSEDLLKDSDDEKNSKKKSNKKSSNKNSSEDNQDAKSKRKNDKLLSMKLTDDSDSDDSFCNKKKKEKSDKRGKKKKILSESDSEVDNKKKKTRNSSESGSNSDSSVVETPKKKRSRIKNASSSSGDENAAGEGSGGKGHRKNIRKVLKKDSLQESTLNALKEEEERKKRIAERQKLYNLLMEECENFSSKTVDKLVLDFDVDSKEELLSVDKDLVLKLKPHQAEGIKFMWDSCFETVKKAKKSKGSGCILAHCMGLGKTLQVVTLIHTLLTNDVGVKNALVLCPLSTVLNWVNEFEKWLSNIGSGQDVDVFHMNKVSAQYRTNQLREWQRRGGVMILGYNLFRLLINPAKKTKLAIKNAYLETLSDPGPDIVVCDEGHLLKNEKTALSKAVEKIKTLRRVVLTGTPLQNNLIEYHCMMQFVKPSLLGTKKEFINRFVNPIENGQFVDSTPDDVSVMKRRAHVLHKMLDGVVQRKAYNVLIPFLPTKFEYVLSLSLSEVQVKLYQHYLDNFSRSSAIGAGTSLFKDRNMLGLICAHPRLLLVQKENELLKRDFEESDEEGSLKDFVVDSTSESSTSSQSSSDDSDSSNSCKNVFKRTRSAQVNDDNEESKEVEEVEKNNEMWWDSIVGENDFEDIGSSTKLLLFFTILQKCEEIGDKILLFSQSLLTLDLIEYFLDQIDTASQGDNPPPGLRGFTGSWVRGIDYFRLDGKTSSDNRANWCNRFNSTDNYRARLFLISTRAGGLGINLTGANRVILFDASWNPSHDVQSIFRVYRFGQNKPCYIYRFLNKGTMEQKVYDRQVTKLSMACRVIDEQQIDRHFSFADLNELYTFTPNEKDDKTPPLPKDRLMAELLQEQKDLVLWYHTHDSLLENQIDEELNEEERKQAWADFENEKKPPPVDLMMSNYGDLFQRVYTTLKDKYPTWPDADIRHSTYKVLSKMNQINYQPAQMQMQPMMMQHPMQSHIVQQPSLQGAPGVFSNPYYHNQNMMMGQRLQNVNRNNMAFGNIQRNTLPNPFAKTLPNPFNQNVHSTFLNQAGTSVHPTATKSMIVQNHNPPTSNK